MTDPEVVEGGPTGRNRRTILVAVVAFAAIAGVLAVWAAQNRPEPTPNPLPTSGAPGSDSDLDSHYGRNNLGGRDDEAGRQRASSGAVDARSDAPVRADFAEDLGTGRTTIGLARTKLISEWLIRTEHAPATLSPKPTELQDR